MCKTTTLLLLCLGFVSLVAKAQIVNIPDANFKAALVNSNNPVIDTNGDGEIQVTEAEATISITAFNQNISSIVGIEAFINLERLVCFNNPISSVDLTNNTQLQQISLLATNLTEIDISNNLQLTFISLALTSISDIDVTQHINLEFLDIGYTNISNIDVTNNLNLRGLSIINLTDINNNLDLSNNILLESIEMRNIGIDSFDFSIFPNLHIVDIGSNNFTDVDFSTNTQLCSLKSRNCPLLNSINVQNGNNQALNPSQTCSISFTIGALTSATGIDAIFGNPNLDFICVDNIQFANDNFNLVPAQTQFVEDCSVLSVDSFSTEHVILVSNPVLDNLKLSNAEQITSVNIYSITGELLFKRKVSSSNEVNFNVSSFASGIYFLTIDSANGRQEVLKFIKQ